MIDDTRTQRLPGLRSAARRRLAGSDLEELRELYSELPAVAEGAAELLGSSGPAPTGMAYERFMELTERMASLLVEIDSILSR